jgi:hypothetical protein
MAELALLDNAAIAVQSSGTSLAGQTPLQNLDRFSNIELECQGKRKDSVQANSWPSTM